VKGSGLAEYIISILELFEAEGRVLKRQAVNTAYSLGFIGVGMLLTVVSIAYLLWALNGVLSGIYGHNLGSLITAAVGMSLSFIFLMVGKWLSK